MPPSSTVSVDADSSRSKQYVQSLLLSATLNLTSSNRSGTRGFFVGYSSAGLPLYNLTSDSIHEAGQSLLRTAKQGFKQIVGDVNSRTIFYFLLLNLCEFRKLY